VVIRSDQYRFIRRGAPTLMFEIAYEKGSAEEAVFKRWLGESYYAPSDDLNQPVDKPSAAFDRLISAAAQWATA
jgi:hypothetical protein